MGKKYYSVFEKQTEIQINLAVTYRMNSGAITIISSPKTSDTYCHKKCDNSSLKITSKIESWERIIKIDLDKVLGFMRK